MQICQQSWHKHGAESKAKSSLCEQLCISYEQLQPSPSLLGMAKGIYSRYKCGESRKGK